MISGLRAVFGVACAVGVVLCNVAPAFAHATFEPGTGAAGKSAAVTLEVANEQENSAIVSVQLSFPKGKQIKLAALPNTEGWTTSVDGGKVGEAVDSVTWSRPSGPASEDAEVSLTLGPLPPSNEQLLFPTLATYANGYVDEWVQVEPDADMPAAEFDVTGGVPTTTTVPAANADDGSNLLVRGGVGLIILAVLGGGVFFVVRRRRA
jgi:uncharacterized protein YcnI